MLEEEALTAHAWLAGGLLAVGDARGELRFFTCDGPVGRLHLLLPGAPRALLPRGRGLVAVFPGALALCAPAPRCGAGGRRGGWLFEPQAMSMCT